MLWLNNSELSKEVEHKLNRENRVCLVHLHMFKNFQTGLGQFLKHLKKKFQNGDNSWSCEHNWLFIYSCLFSNLRFPTLLCFTHSCILSCNSDVTLTPHNGDGTKFLISYQVLAFLSILGHSQLIQNLPLSTLVWRQCDIRITAVDLLCWPINWLLNLYETKCW